MSARMRNPMLSICAFGLAVTVWQAAAWAETVPAKGSPDARIRTAAYDSNEVYRLHGFVGYQIDLEFEPGETFVGLGSGDLEGLAFVGQENHLFLKPKAAKVATNLTVLTSRRHY
jgi:type IV secretion system protein VirB9